MAKYKCQYCGSPSIIIDAYAEWDDEQEDWVLFSYFVDAPAVCNECGRRSALSNCIPETQ